MIRIVCRSLCRGCGGCSFPGTPALTRRPRKIGAKEDGDDHDENALHLPRRHLAAAATEAAAPEATEASTAASRCIAGPPAHGYEPTREAAMAVFAKSWRREQFW